MIIINFKFRAVQTPSEAKPKRDLMLQIVKSVIAKFFSINSTNLSSEQLLALEGITSYANKPLKYSHLFDDGIRFLIEVHGCHLSKNKDHMNFMAHIFSLMAIKNIHSEITYESILSESINNDVSTTVNIHDYVELGEDQSNGLSDEGQCPLTLIDISKLKFPARLKGSPQIYDLFHLYRCLFSGNLPRSPYSRIVYDYSAVEFIPININQLPTPGM